MQASNGHVDSALAALTPEDQRMVWTLATLMMDTTEIFGQSVAAFLNEKLPQLPQDAEMTAALAEHAAADAREVLVTLRAGMDPSAHETPIEAIEHARYLRQRGVGLNTLIQIYQYGFAVFRDLLILELQSRCSDPNQLTRIGAAADAYSFPFVGAAMQRLAYDYGSLDGAWTPTAEDPVLTNPESLRVAQATREDSMARGTWVAATPQESSSRARAEKTLDEFVATLESGVRDRGLDDRLALAATTITLTLADEPDLSVTLLLDRSPIEVVDGTAEAEAQLWIASVDLPRLWSADFFPPMAIAKGRMRTAGPVRKFLRIVPILRTVGEAPTAPTTPSDTPTDSY